MAADITQEIDVVERVEPIGIVGHDGVAAGILEFQELVEDRANAFEIFIDHLVGEQPPALVLAGRIADARGAAAHQRDRAMPGLLQPIEHHDRQQRADMQRRRGAIEADISSDRFFARERVQRIRLGDLMDKAPGGQDIQKIGFVRAHSLLT